MAPDNSWDFHAPPPLTEEEAEKAAIAERVRIANEDWPFDDEHCPERLVLTAPFSPNQFSSMSHKRPFLRVPAVQPSIFFRLTHSLWRRIFDYMPNFRSMGNFSAACQLTFRIARNGYDHWDVSKAQYNMCDQNTRRDGYVGGVGNDVLVMKFRTRVKHGADNPTDFACDMYAFQSLTQACYNFKDNFFTLQLHRIPMLNTQGLLLIIPHLRNLKHLGIYACPLLHFADTLQILDILRIDRTLGSNVALDYYPRFHVGPKDIDGTGPYGVTWDSFQLDPRLAIWQLLTKILPKAKAQGVDLLQKDSAFYFWLQKCDFLWRLDDTLAIIMHIYCDNSERSKQDTIDDYELLAYQVNRAGIAANRNNPGDQPWGNDWVTEYIPCRTCQSDVLAIFFDYGDYLRYIQTSQGEAQRCLGCKLTTILDGEIDHYKNSKHKMVRFWIRDDADDIERVLRRREDVIQEIGRVWDPTRFSQLRDAGVREMIWKQHVITMPGENWRLAPRVGRDFEKFGKDAVW